MTTMSVVGECFFWYRLTRVVPDKFHRAVKRLCVCMKIVHTVHIKHTQPFYSCLDFVQDNPGDPVPAETFTHSPIMVINHPFSASSMYYDPWHPPCSIYVPDSLFPQSLSKFSWSSSYGASCIIEYSSVVIVSNKHNRRYFNQILFTNRKQTCSL